ncbi:MAG TPA: hypothetical protein VL401_01925 [Alphaproteobacteria bacterium]|jgi:hypothetical protein|nr:hypothetical protein [Alphaproteobacteria bacterium]
MAIKLNLLPTELSVSKGLTSTLKFSKMLGVILLGLFIVFVIGVSAFFIISTFTLKNLTNEVAGLENQIKTQEVSEQQLVLLKDRLKKITLAKNQASSLPNLIAFEPFLSPLSADASVNELTVDTQKISASVNFKSNSELAAFIQNLSSSKVFKSVVVASLGFNPITGYLLSLSITVK